MNNDLFTVRHSEKTVTIQNVPVLFIGRHSRCSRVGINSRICVSCDQVFLLELLVSLFYL